ncbi:MAG: hypothetical protein AB1641_09415 [Thermodesulfobacteriota bacterium]
MWAELQEEVELELAQIWRQLNLVAELRQKVRQTPPNHVEIMALAAFLHAFYNGVENLFKRVAKRLDPGSPRGEVWHSQLLQLMAQPSDKRPAIISETLRDKLRPYMTFRHVFRHAYSYELQWTKMAPLILDIELVFQELASETQAFLATLIGTEQR